MFCNVTSNVIFFLLVSFTTADKFLVNRHYVPYYAEELSDDDFYTINLLSDVPHLKEAVKQILLPRVVGTKGHKKVRQYIIKSLCDLQWSVELHKFHDKVPILGQLEFQNIIATLNPKAERYLILSCHYDSKYMGDLQFLGATDAANTPLSLMLIFFDGEEAFEEWLPEDSLYGSRRLARKWETEGFLDKIDMLVLLDLLGSSDPTFYNFFSNTESFYSQLLSLERRLAKTGFSTYSSNQVQPHRYFQAQTLRSASLQDDHTPFLKRGVPILHIIPLPFPSFWHTVEDNESVIDYVTTENLARIVRLFTMQYLFSGIANKI
ncbi:glutaminyl-peptide cyclotransferase-like isoform X3 [Glossina fuscipes]|uniref:glutaminyl-peptide cyclotransferase n=1 Tax=Glossina fuscipes TaxID=7396 RepID=A0A8U0W5T1_9MUSC|nr:glutaminyl-peptide cyclotransferase-like isoform X3 [Glossina fuscipes]